MHNMLIVGMHNENELIWLPLYESILQGHGVMFEKTLFERKMKNNVCKKGNTYVFSAKTSNNFSKIIPFLRYRRFVLSLIKSHCFDGLIIMGSTCAILLSRYLLKESALPYIFDYRDVTVWERLTMFKKIVRAIAIKAPLVFSSSKGFIGPYLPETEKTFVVHNISNVTNVTNITNSANMINAAKSLYDACNERCIIGFVGNVRYFSVNRKLMDAFESHKNYILKYIGEGDESKQLQAYCKAKMYEKVIFQGRFNNSDKPSIYADIDIINAVYDSTRYDVPYATPNKLYDAALYKKPMLVAAGTYLATIVEEYHLGCALNMNASNEEIVKKVEEYVSSFDEKIFE